MQNQPDSRLLDTASHRLVVFTIVSKNYLSSARVLMNSVRDHQPDAQRVVILVDELQGMIDPGMEIFDIIPASDLGIANWKHFAFKYDILELNTAVKPFAFQHLFESYHAGKVIYFDPDIQLYSSLKLLDDELDQHVAVLTPHLTRPITDRYLPSELDILRAGSYNLGFFALARRGDWLKIIQWWQSKLYVHGSRDTSQGLFVDQRWMDLAPSLFSGVTILRDPGHNVAYWNLGERKPSFQGGRYFIDGVPLVFFHFSGFEVDNPELVSKHQNRHRLSSLTDEYQTIYAEYRQALLNCGYEQTRGLPYAYAAFRDDVPIPPAIRRCLLEVDAEGDEWADPFSDLEFRAWATTPGGVPGSSLISQYALTLHRMRPDLQAAFPDPLGASERAYAGWFVSQDAPAEFFHAVYVAPIRQALLTSQVETPNSRPRRPRTGVDRFSSTARYFLDFPTKHKPMLPPDALKGPTRVYTGPDNLYGKVRSSLKDLGLLSFARRLVGVRVVMTARHFFSYGAVQPHLMPVPPADLPGEYADGVNVIGYFRHESGVGQIARDLVKCLDTQRLPISCIDAETPSLVVPSDVGPSGLLHRVNIFNVNADQTYVVQSKLGRNAYKGRYNIGYWFWELPQFPERWKVALLQYNEIWVASNFVRDAVCSVTDLPVTRVPVPIEIDLPDPMLTRSAVGLPEDAFLFLFVFNGASVFQRKNPLGLVEAFEAAFTRSDRARDVKLVIKVMNLDLREGDGEKLSRAVQDVGGILLGERMDRRTTYALTSLADAYVSLHRSEGYGLTMAEAMALGKPVVGTAFSGNLDFMDASNSYLVPCTMVELKEDHPPYQAGNTWAEPDVAEAARIMRDIVNHPAEARKRGEVARAYMESNYSVEAVGRVISDRVHAVMGK